MAHLPSQWQQLIDLLMADPPVPYAEISDQLGLPVGSIGPTRGRCLAKLRVLLEASLGGSLTPTSLASARGPSSSSDSFIPSFMLRLLAICYFILRLGHHTLLHCSAWVL